MATRASGMHVHRRTVPLEAISPALWQTVIGSEDSRFCSEFGFDFQAVDKAIKDHEDGERLRGASTISQQTAKNAFLWPGRNFVRKGIEAYFTVLIETLWSKRRIMEVYLNTIEFGPGVFGAEAASERFFHKPARNLTPHEAALLAAVLPNPKRMHANAPSTYVLWRAYTLEDRAGLVRKQGLARCIGG
jgi:monofunctional biosynthetic peptidoglycan transglycosylase